MDSNSKKFENYVEFLKFRLKTAIIVYGKPLKTFAKDTGLNLNDVRFILYQPPPKHHFKSLLEFEHFLNDFERDYYELDKLGLLDIPDMDKAGPGDGEEIPGEIKGRLHREKVHKADEGDDEDKRIQKKFKVKRRKKRHRRIKRYNFRRSYQEIRDNIARNSDNNRDFLSCYCRLDSKTDTPLGEQSPDADGEGDRRIHEEGITGTGGGPKEAFERDNG